MYNCSIMDAISQLVFTIEHAIFLPPSNPETIDHICISYIYTFTDDKKWYIFILFYYYTDKLF